MRSNIFTLSDSVKNRTPVGFEPVPLNLVVLLFFQIGLTKGGSLPTTLDHQTSHYQTRNTVNELLSEMQIGIYDDHHSLPHQNVTNTLKAIRIHIGRLSWPVTKSCSYNLISWPITKLHSYDLILLAAQSDCNTMHHSISNHSNSRRRLHTIAQHKLHAIVQQKQFALHGTYTPRTEGPSLKPHTITYSKLYSILRYNHNECNTRSLKTIIIKTHMYLLTKFKKPIKNT